MLSFDRKKQNSEKQLSFNKEIVVHIHNEMLLSHKMEHVQVSSNELDEPRTYYTE